MLTHSPKINGEIFVHHFIRLVEGLPLFSIRLFGGMPIYSWFNYKEKGRSPNTFDGGMPTSYSIRMTKGYSPNPNKIDGRMPTYLQEFWCRDCNFCVQQHFQKGWPLSPNKIGPSIDHSIWGWMATNLFFCLGGHGHLFIFLFGKWWTFICFSIWKGWPPI